ncbi:Succinate dehydrogenase cytochrome b560 subunit, mitochondrial [Daphnia magna]|uniref:Succinate dehydrogenase cytochrome b560 subunit, mitochondrial n=1 Tax=Daphnia magna TaxID=35525 RepID=A0A162CJ24_9CRUS|nr:Succinate dehydrogenase cytochrome b560 subunit, mitochondrial [Daphnia magna]
MLQIPVHREKTVKLPYKFLTDVVSRLQQKSWLNLKAKEMENTGPVLEGVEFEIKNKNLKRPLSPHLSIHVAWSNMILSMTHRFTGIFLFAIPFGLASVAILLPESYPDYLGMLEDMHLNQFIIATTKFLIALPFSFHFLNGIRHLIWDTGHWLTIKEVNWSGYIIVVLAVALAIHLTSL